MKKFRVSHFPQVPCKSFQVEVDTLEAAVDLKLVFAAYDAFQLVEGIKPDYANATAVEQFVDGEWEDVDENEDEYVEVIEKQNASKSGMTILNEKDIFERLNRF